MIQLQPGRKYLLRDGQVIEPILSLNRSGWLARASYEHREIKDFWNHDGTFQNYESDPNNPLHVVEDLGPVEPRGTEGILDKPIGVAMDDFQKGDIVYFNPATGKLAKTIEGTKGETPQWGVASVQESSDGVNWKHLVFCKECGRSNIPTEPDWEYERWQAAKAIMAGAAASPNVNSAHGLEMAETAIQWADALVAEFRKTEK